MIVEDLIFPFKAKVQNYAFFNSQDRNAQNNFSRIIFQKSVKYKLLIINIVYKITLNSSLFMIFKDRTPFFDYF